PVPWPMATASARPRPRCWRGPSAGVLGAPTPPSISGRRNNLPQPLARSSMPSSQAHRFRLDRATTPIGVALLVTDDEGRLCALDWEEFEQRISGILRRLYGTVA